MRKRLISSLFCSLLAVAGIAVAQKSPKPGKIAEPAVAHANLVYFSAAGHVFHRKGCPKMPKKVTEVTRETAVGRDLKPCKICKP